MKKLLTFLLVVMMAFSFAACNDDNGGKNPPPLGNVPTQSDWADAGLGSSFGANVTGSLTLNVAEEGGIFMEWKNSNRDSFDDTVNWLQSQGYTQWLGSGAQVEADGAFVTYTAQKTDANGQSKIVEVVYVTQDTSIAGQSFKAGDLYFSVDQSTVTPPTTPGTTAVWPASQIQEVLGVSIPEYTGAASSFVFSNGSHGAIKNVAVTAYGVAEGADGVYGAALLQNGYTESEGTYAKQLSGGDSIEIYVYCGATMHPSTYQSVVALQISVLYVKNSGALTAWNQMDLSDFSDAGIPAFVGGSSFDFQDVGEETKNAQTAGLQQAINILAAYENMLNDDQKAELAALRAKLPYVEQIEAVTVTVYGTNDDQVYAYQTALESAGFAYGEKNTADFQYTADISSLDDGGKATITFVKMPQALLQESGNGGGTQQPTTYYTMPDNVKIVYTYGMGGVATYTYTVIKVGDDYYRQEMASGIVWEELYFKKNGNGWDVYRKSSDDAEWRKDGSQETQRSYVESDAFDFIVADADVTEYDDTVKGSQETVAGRTVDVYTQYGSTVYCKDTQTGLILKYSISSQGYTLEYVVTEFDTTVTGFGSIVLP